MNMGLGDGLPGGWDPQTAQSRGVDQVNLRDEETLMPTQTPRCQTPQTSSSVTVCMDLQLRHQERSRTAPPCTASRSSLYRESL
ncbi:hypothetical protein ANANG_G00095560 [Anguilla anguilla]|uniref:Uncharacterized protein n=1 Tax=Anguilla anguilla TaxID=7936 RepID=A0A9D3MHL7_ANGAN|nr:hypothetical protein ANANG_G00095560 [Anguilla anguilla]